MDPVKLNLNHTLRDPMGNSSRYAEVYGYQFERLNQSDLSGYSESGIVRSMTDRLRCMHGLGYPLAKLVSRVVDDIPCMQLQTEQARSDMADRAFGLIWGCHRGDFSFMALALMLLPERSQLHTLVTLLNTRPGERNYVLDLLLSAFVPGWQMAKKYTRKHSVNSPLPWSDPVVRALAQSPERRPEALSKYMKSWCRIMKPLGYKPVRDYSPEAAERRGELEGLFVHFAFEVALAVCAYDIDDADFRDHPYYPRDLVDYYRANLRHGRDAWRAQGLGAGIEIEVPPLPKKLDLSKSKSKGLVRWLELVSDGDADAVAAVIEQVGKLRKVKDLSELSCALAESGAGIHVDLKDDETLCSQLDTLAQRRQLDGFDAPPDASAGPDGCIEILLFGSTWFQARGYRLVDVDGDDDAWHAVVVKAEHHDEFLALSLQLALTAREPSDVYTE